jgi:hypothetical protein
MKRLLFLVVLASLFYIGCSEKHERKVTPAFYYWKGVFETSTGELRYLKLLRVKKLYLRFFDVDWNQNIKQAVPVGDLEINSDIPRGIEIIPTIFITNRTLINIPDTAVFRLGHNILEKIYAKSGKIKDIKLREIQLDCDWSLSTKDKYFKLIDDIKSLASKDSILLSVTIRLHQVKYFYETGVPPVSKGMLMFYNMSSVSDYHTRNSIFDPEVAKKYLVNFDKYPLNLDVVLPAFSWGVHFRRYKVVGLINDLSAEELLKTNKFKKIDDTHFICTKNCADFGTEFNRNDVIRIEKIGPEQTLDAARMISKYLKKKNLTVAIYHLNDELVKQYEIQDLQNIFSAFR